MDRRPRAPVFRSSASLAIAFKASSVTFSSHYKYIQKERTHIIFDDDIFLIKPCSI